jgi:hypothetical protein
MVVSRGLNLPSRFSAKFEDILRKMHFSPPSIFYKVTAFVTNPTYDVFCIRYTPVPICASLYPPPTMYILIQPIPYCRGLKSLKQPTKKDRIRNLNFVGILHMYGR